MQQSFLESSECASITACAAVAVVVVSIFSGVMLYLQSLLLVLIQNLFLLFLYCIIYTISRKPDTKITPWSGHFIVNSISVLYACVYEELAVYASIHQ